MNLSKTMGVYGMRSKTIGCAASRRKNEAKFPSYVVGCMEYIHMGPLILAWSHRHAQDQQLASSLMSRSTNRRKIPLKRSGKEAEEEEEEGEGQVINYRHSYSYNG